MLKGISKIVSPGLIKTLCEMGHGDEIVITDGNFPAETFGKRVIRADGKNGQILAATPMKKFGEISDLIGCLLWLSSDKASGFVTGTVIPVDGGFSAYSGV